MRWPCFIISTFRSGDTAWARIPEHPKTLKDARARADAIVANAKGPPIIATVKDSETGQTLYVCASGRFDDLLSRSKTT